MAPSEHSAHGENGERCDGGETASARRPGRELASERERIGLDRAQMASRLHLPERQVEALEQDDYQHLPPPAFVRGYLRAYAREVGVAGDDIVGAYEALGPGAEEPEIRPVEAGTRGSGRRATVVSLVVLIGAVAIAFGAWLWQARQQPGAGAFDMDATDSVAAEAEADGAGDTDTAADTSGAETTPQTEPATDAPAPDAEATSGSASDEAGASSDAGAAGESDGGEDAATDAAATDETVAPAASAGDDGSTTAAAESDDQADPSQAEDAYDPPSATSSAERATAPAASEGPDTLALAFAQRSWVEVYDDRGRQLVYTLYTGDAPLRLRGWAPFDVFLGNSPAVRVRFDDEAVSKGAFTRSDQTARFRVDADGARRR
jgi:cytoskeleton protein RodZ